MRMTLIISALIVYLCMHIILVPLILQSVLAAFGLQVSFLIAFAIWNLFGVIMAVIKN